MTAVAQWLKTPGIYCYVAGSIPAVTPGYSSSKIRNALWSKEFQHAASFWPCSVCAMSQRNKGTAVESYTQRIYLRKDQIWGIHFLHTVRLVHTNLLKN
jgi:hypothetical protein